ncbi:NUDIX hydrolase [Patescibacteria group bacterium]|nr:NUDIX hydrolase [Patescibacteria group bacterium]
MPTDEYLNIVDASDKTIGKKLRTEISKSDIYRVSSLWVFDQDKNLLVAQRPEWKKHDSGKWTESAVGTVEHGETYESNLVKEAWEELGIKPSLPDLVFISKQFHESKNGRMFGAMYAILLDQVRPKIDYSQKEVSNIDWVSHSDMISQLANIDSRFVDGLEKFYTEVWEKVSSVK